VTEGGSEVAGSSLSCCRSKRNWGKDGNRIVAAETVALLRLDRKVGAGEGGRGENTEMLGDGGAGESVKTPSGLAGLAHERLADILGLSKIRQRGGGCAMGELIILTDVLHTTVNGEKPE
jgi:hypothetical protein